MKQKFENRPLTGAIRITYGDKPFTKTWAADKAEVIGHIQKSNYNN